MTYMDNYILEDAVYTRTEIWQTFPLFASKLDIENDYSKWQFFMKRNVDYSRLFTLWKNNNISNNVKLDSSFSNQFCFALMI